MYSTVLFVYKLVINRIFMLYRLADCYGSSLGLPKCANVHICGDPWSLKNRVLMPVAERYNSAYKCAVGQVLVTSSPWRVGGWGVGVDGSH